MIRMILFAGIILGIVAVVMFATGILAAIRGGEDSSSLALGLILGGSFLEPVAIALVIFGAMPSGPEGMPKQADPDEMVLYHDTLIAISESGITFMCYYFPRGAKYVPFDMIDRIECWPSQLNTGKWRQWGTGDFVTWFPLDSRRYQRDVIFRTYLRGTNWRIGFTTEDSHRVREILSDKVQIEERGGFPAER